MAAAYTLEARGLSKRFQANQALQGVTIGLRPAEVHAVVGENGAGKSTLMNILCGKLVPDEGALVRDGRAVRFATPADAQRAGIAMAPQELTLCPLLSVAENVLLGSQKSGMLGVDWRATRRAAREHLAELDETIDPDVPAGSLSTARQQLVQIARATASRADILIFDEPTASLTTRETGHLFAFIDRFRRRGGAVFYVSHRLEEILALADRVSVLRDGTLVVELDPATTTKDEMVRHMAGRPAAPARRPAREAEGQGREVTLRVRGLRRAGEFEGIDLELRRGEILGVSGLVGSGRTELAKCIFGLTAPDAGTIEIDGRPVRHRSPAEAIRNGLVYLPEERKREGIFPLLGVGENIAIASLQRFRRFWGLSRAAMLDAAGDYVRRLGIRPATVADPITSLSGGNQQKAILARWLMSACRILILDEPTRGIDVNAKLEIQALLRELARSSLAILYISSELQEVLDVADRVLVMHEGRVKGVVPAAGTTQDMLLGLAMS
jgi:ABC-type sugar transport system ATPase subunit